ncbi:methyltransferase domain-containing protein [Tropicimonas sp. IMCC6043]|uniref:methyltransferase domain-containing protein n=1 Tax=Tropicimonas sp. IMCC6043 TaxID=2510645 RepID=UPI00101DD7AD|nr:methyltransferase domain-containing protein [Tropicimonas sp. IMCC6043]RYH08930.1 methyltransferase domain-containing protein [Tropicimonas sp. IMCC6043]
MDDWNAAHYLDFADLRLRPALDLLAAVPALPDGDVVDLGCGAGNLGPAMAARFQGHRLIGIDSSPAMLERARAESAYQRLEQSDIAQWIPDRRPALIYSNAALQWLPEHGYHLPRLARELAPGGVLAVQMPRQGMARAQMVLRELSAALFPDRFDWSDWTSPVAEPEEYATVLAPLGALSLWETVYYQRLEPSREGHPIRLFSQSTVARPILEKLTEAETETFLVAVDAALADQYPSQPDGTVLYPFRRLFFTLTRPG